MFRKTTNRVSVKSGTAVFAASLSLLLGVQTIVLAAVTRPYTSYDKGWKVGSDCYNANPGDADAGGRCVVETCDAAYPGDNANYNGCILGALDWAYYG